MVRLQFHQNGDFFFQGKFSAQKPRLPPPQLHGRPLRCSFRYILHAHDISARRIAEKTFILPDKLRRAFVPDSHGGLRHVVAFGQHEALGFTKTQPLLVLQGAQRRYPFEVFMEC